MDQKTYLPILFTSFNSQYRQDTVMKEQSPKKRMIEKLKQFRHNLSSNRKAIQSQLSSIVLPQFNHLNTLDEYFTIEDKPQPEKKGKNVLLGRHINNKEMLSKLVYANQMTKDSRILFENKRDKSSSFKTQPNAFGYTLCDPLDTTLLFESNFECGNLLAAFKIEATSYHLLLQSDTNTTGYNKWFFFAVRNMRKGCRYTFTIINNLRQSRLYAKGIKVFTYSTQKNSEERIGWHHSGEEICLYPSNLYQFNNNRKQRLYTLAFTYESQYDNDFVFFANCIPYSYSQVMKEMRLFKESKLPYYAQSTLCQSLGGNDLDYFLIDDRTQPESERKEEKEGLVFFARQHPSETVGSWVMQGVMDFLMGSSEEARYLRKHFEILVIPMVNIDGVIAGNTRTSYAGCDLNRKWKRPKKNKHPEIYYIKELIRQFSLKRKIMCLVDFHGHHGAFNSFFYCNYNEDDINKARVFPYACAKSSNSINFDQCCFSMMRYKHGSGRINLFKEFAIENACTLETSCFGFDRGVNAFKYINEAMLQEIGRDVCMGVVTYHFYKHSSLNEAVALSERIEESIRPVLNELIEGKMNIKEEDFTDVNGSNSDDDDNNENEVNVIEDEEEDVLDDDETRDKPNSIRNFNTNYAKVNEVKTEIAPYSYKPAKLPKIKAIKLKVSASNIIEKASPPHMTDPIALNMTEEIKPLKEQLLLPRKKPSDSQLTLNGTTISPKGFDVSNCQSNVSLAVMLKIKESLFSTRVQKTKQPRGPIGAKKCTINLMAISPRKFYATRESSTQTEDIYFEMKMIYFNGSHKMIGFDAERERQLNRKCNNCLKAFFNPNDKGDLTNNKEAKSTQT